MITAGVSRVASGLLCVHAIAITPAGSMKLVRSFISIDCGLPCVTVRSAPAIIVSGPAQRSLTLWPARSPSRLATLYIESSDSFVASAAVSIVTGWSEPVPGRELHPLKPSAFSRRTVSPTIPSGACFLGVLHELPNAFSVAFAVRQPLNLPLSHALPLFWNEMASLRFVYPFTLPNHNNRRF